MSISSNAPQRDSWGSKIGFILASAGSAVGLGNMWRFSYLASEGGGAVFVFTYMVCVAVVGIPLMTSEFVVGRMAQVSPARALARYGGAGWKPVGYLFIFCGFGILSYYSVIAGWTLRYALDAVRHSIPADTGAYFGQVSAGTDAVIAHVIFMCMTIAIVIGGIKDGLERANLIMMPALFLILISLAVWASTLPGANEGYAFYLRPDFSELTFQIAGSAMGQAFFSLSLGMGALMTYASYLKSKGNVPKEAVSVALCDFSVAFLAGLTIFPIIFSFGILGQMGESTVGALFISLPAGFKSLGGAGDWIALVFFVMLFFAAITSAISLLEVVVTAAVDSGIARRNAAMGAGIIAMIAGLPAAYNTNILGAMDAVIGQYLLLVGGLLIALFVGWKIYPQARAELNEGLNNDMVVAGWSVLVRYVAPVLIGVMLVFLARPTWTAVQTAIQSLGN